MATIETLLSSQYNGDEDKFVGTLLGVMIGDTLGAAVEGTDAEELLDEHENGLRDFIQCVHLGAEFDKKLRYGMYTDDTQTTLALAHSLVSNEGLNPLHVARNYAEFYNEIPFRGYPKSAQIVLQKVLKREMSILETGTLAFEGGSYANGGAMRISPLGLAFRNASDDELREAVRMAIVSSHVHPEAIDGAFLQAKAVSLLIKEDKSTFDPSSFLEKLREASRTQEMKDKFQLLLEHLKRVKENPKINDLTILPTLVKGYEDEEDGYFQLRTSHALACSFWAFVRRYENPEEALIGAVSLGGDTDTVASLTGACLGALHGTSWIPTRWFKNLENGEKGRDYCIDLSRKLKNLDLHSVLPFDESLPSEPPKLNRQEITSFKSRKLE